MKSPDYALEQVEVVMSWDHIGLGKLDEHLAHLCPAVGTLVMETLVEKLQELLFGGVVHLVGVWVPTVDGEHVLNDVGKDLDDGLS